MGAHSAKSVCGFLRSVSVVTHAFLSLMACTVLAQTIKDSHAGDLERTCPLAEPRPVLLPLTPPTPTSTSVSLDGVADVALLTVLCSLEAVLSVLACCNVRVMSR